MQAEEQALARVDTLAQKAVAWVAPIRFAIAQTEAEREAVYRLRYQAVIEHRWLRSTDLPNGLEQDAYDARAVHIVAWDDHILAATSRLVFPATGWKVPTEDAFELEIEPRGKVVDAGRFVVARAYSSIEHRLLAALLSRTWLQVRALGYSYVCAAFASATMVRLYRRMGVLATPLAPPGVYWGEERYPVRFEVAQSAAMVNERWFDKIERELRVETAGG